MGNIGTISVPSWETVVFNKRAARDVAIRPYLSKSNDAIKKSSIITNIDDIETLVGKLGNGDLMAREVIEAYILRCEA